MQGAISGKPQLNRRINASLVFGMIRSEGPISRADLAKRTGIRSTSISAIVEHLMAKNLVHEIGRGVSTGGRHPILIEVNAGGLYAAGIEVGEDALNGVVVDLSGKTLATEDVSLPDTSVETVTTRGDVLLEKMAKAAGIGRGKFGAVGVAVPGIITRERNAVVLSGPLGWQNVPIKMILDDKWRTEVHILNNAMAGAMTEYFNGLGQTVRSLLYVLVYLKHVRRPTLTSLGCGIVLDGRAYYGEGQMAGEVRADIEHPLALAGRELGAGAPQAMDALVAASFKEPQRFAPVWKTFAENLGRVIAWGMDFLNPGRVVIGTDTAELREMIGDAMLDIVRARTISGLVEELPVGVSKAAVRLDFSPLAKDTLARGAIVPRLQELSLAPLLRDSVLS